MSEWYYARDNKQHGPVSLEDLIGISRGGGLDPAKDLVWSAHMKDWTAAGMVPELRSTVPQVPSLPENSEAGGAWQEIPHGSESIDVMACVKRGFQLCFRNFGIVLIVGITYLGVSVLASMILEAVDTAFQLVPPPPPFASQSSELGFWAEFQKADRVSPLNSLLTQILSIFLSLGVTRIGLNLISGKPVAVSMLFGGGRKLFRAAIATLLYVLMVGLGLCLLIVPGIYLALRFGHYQAAIVDRDLGILEAFQYSSSLTTNNRLNLFVLVLLSLLIAVLGCLSLIIGLVFAIPVIWLSWLVAYRCMQFGHRALLDQPGTTQPMLAEKTL
jgi:hypothetical protein